MNDRNEELLKNELDLDALEWTFEFSKNNKYLKDIQLIDY